MTEISARILLAGKLYPSHMEMVICGSSAWGERAVSEVTYRFPFHSNWKLYPEQGTQFWRFLCAPFLCLDMTFYSSTHFSRPRF